MSILITGATGFVGSSFLARLLASPEAEGRQIFTLQRASDDQAERLERALARACHAVNRSDATPAGLAKSVTILTGDVTQPRFGLSGDAQMQLTRGKISEIWHIASELSPASAEQNVTAAKALADLAQALGVKKVRYLSTAYVTGKGEVTCDITDPKTGNTFNNAYEESKAQAEAILTEAAQTHGWRLTLLRPSIIVGARDSKLPAGSTSALYGVIRVLAAKARKLADKGETPRVSLACGKGALNLTYIDRVIDVMMEELADTTLNAAVKTRFIGGSNVPVSTLVAALRDRLSLRIVCTEDPAKIDPADKSLNEALSFFAPYTLASNSKTFTGEVLEEQDKIYEIDALNLIEAAVNEARNGALMDRMQMIHLQRASGGPVVAYVNRDYDETRETVMLVNAYGMPANALHPLITSLGKQGFNTVTWDCRGLPDRGFDLATETGLSMKDHFDDWELISAALGIRQMHLMGWSTGAVVASHIAAKAPKRITKLALINGSFMHRKAELTPFQKNLKSIMPKVAVSMSIAKVLYNSVFKEDRSAMVRLFTRDIANKANEAMSVTLPHEKHIVQGLTANPDQVFRYARLIRAFIKEDPMDWLGEIKAPTALFTGAGDITAHPRGSYDASCVIPGARLHVDNEATHLSLYSSPDFIAEMVGFLTGQSAPDGAQRKAA
ncbi:alpha/beta fold hydrolase [Pacificoceanicola onchidii]|uniref:alpha/beta fold hydrolase n=1 Tax=Pacificoceanicola onchidii TaxID=2562685 RepID=UPI0014560524|nr:alpha/beta fold hydrolase [Pacificoceanicola onchidii]